MRSLGKDSSELGEESSPPFINKTSTVGNSQAIYGEFTYKHVPKLHWEFSFQKVCTECANGYYLPRP